MATIHEFDVSIWFVHNKQGKFSRFLRKAEGIVAQTVLEIRQYLDISYIYKLIYICKKRVTEG